MWLLPSSQLTSDRSCVNWSTRSHTDGEDGEINLTKIQDWPPHHGVELPAVSIGHQAVELRPLFAGARDAGVDVLPGDLPPSAVAMVLST